MRIDYNFQQEPIHYYGCSKQLCYLWYKNLLLSLLSFGIYRFWGLTELRKYIYGSHQIRNQRFVYLGTEKDLLLGFILSLPLLLPFCFAFFIFFSSELNISLLALIYYIFIRKLFVYSSLRYKISNIYWAGLNGELNGNSLKFAATQSFYTYLCIGLLFPYISIKKFSYIFKHLNIAGKPVIMKKNPHRLLRYFFLNNLLLIPTLGYSHAVYRKKLYEHLFSCLQLGDIRINLKCSAFEIWKLNFSNFLILLISFGLAYPYVLHRRLLFQSQILRFSGELKLESARLFQKQSKHSDAGFFNYDLDLAVFA